MKRLNASMVSIALAASLAGAAAAEDSLEKLKNRGALVAGVTDDAPPFGFRKEGAGPIVGYDADFVAALATRLGVKLELRAVTEANRISELMDGNIDVIAANLTRTGVRTAVIAFSDSYLVTGQKFLARRGSVKSLGDLDGKKIGAVIGTPSELSARDRCKKATVLAFDDYLQGIQALDRGDSTAFTTDETILADLMGRLPKGAYEIPDVFLAQAMYRLGLRKGEQQLVDFVNASIREMQQSGEAKQIRDRWFAPPEELPAAAYGAVVRRAATRAERTRYFYRHGRYRYRYR